MAQVITFRQERLGKEILKNVKRKHPLNKTQLLVKVGYSKKTASALQKRSITSQGVQLYLKQQGIVCDRRGKKQRSLR